MGFFDDGILERILAYALQDNPNPFNLLCCRRFRDICYKVTNNGLPFHYPTTMKIHRRVTGKDEWKIANPDRDYFVKQLLSNNIAYVKHSIARAPDFVISTLYYPIQPYKGRFLLVELVQNGMAEMLHLLLDNLKLQLLEDAYMIWTLLGAALYQDGSFTDYRPRGLAPPRENSTEGLRFWYTYVRPFIVHNMKYNFNLERSVCYGGHCRYFSPVHHRGRVLAGILKFDDIELFERYLAQRVLPDRYGQPQVTQPYSLADATRLFFYYLPEKIYKAHPELFELRNLPGWWNWLKQEGNLERGLAIGLRLWQIDALRVALASKRVDCARTLLERYTYKLTRQSRAHLHYQIAAVGLDPKLLQEEVKL